MFIICLIICVVSILGFVVLSGLYITCLGISKMLEHIEEVCIKNEKRKSINISNKELLKK